MLEVNNREREREREGGRVREGERRSKSKVGNNTYFFIEKLFLKF